MNFNLAFVASHTCTEECKFKNSKPDIHFLSLVLFIKKFQRHKWVTQRAMP